MLERADEKDKLEEEKTRKLIEEFDKISSFKKIWDYNSPKMLIIPTILLTAMSGIAQPIFAIIFAKILGILTAPFDFLELV